MYATVSLPGNWTQGSSSGYYFRFLLCAKFESYFMLCGLKTSPSKELTNAHKQTTC